MKKTIALMFFWCILDSAASAQEFRGKTVTIIVGTVAGDLYDLYARAIALFMGKYLPGNPNIVVQNMPGAGHMIAANYVYTVAKTGWFDPGSDQCRLVFRAADRPIGSQVRLDEIHLGRQRDQITAGALHAG